MAVGPIDAENQTPFLNEVAENTILITQDADAPMSNRLVYIGANNYKAGRALGKLVKDAIPMGKLCSSWEDWSNSMLGSEDRE